MAIHRMAVQLVTITPILGQPIAMIDPIGDRAKLGRRMFGAVDARKSPFLKVM